jgi:ketosteroid isomerase-like protein
MFDWAHELHRQIYDVYADERLSAVEREALVERLTDYYLTRRDVAFTVAPKSMALMDEQYFSQVFRRRYPEFNGLIWAYHWLQVGLYEPLIAGETPDQQKAGVQAAVARFWEMLRDPPASMPRVMPMTATIAPRFTARHPRAAAIFDNLHIMHDIISDILAADTVPRDRKRHVIYEALEEFRDSTRNVMSRDEWLMMGDHMGGIMAMGGPPIGALPEQEAPPAPVGGHDAHAGHAMPGAAVAPVQTPDAVVLQFHQAVRRGDTTAALALLSPDVVIYEGGGVESSRDEFARGHLGADMAYAAATTREVTSTAAHVVGDVAWVINTTHVTGTFRGREVNSRGTETVVLRRIEGQWRIVHIHWSSRRVQP